MTKEITSIRHILLVAHFFPPLNEVAAHRPFQWAKYWARMGIKVTVLTSAKYAFDGPLDLEVEIPEGVCVKEVDYLPVFLKGFLDQEPNKADVSKAKTEQAGKSMIRRGLMQINRLRKALLSPTGTLVEAHDLWIKKAVAEGAKILEAGDVDVMVSTYGPSSCYKIAARLVQRFPKIPWAADYRDLWTGNYDRQAKGPFRLLEARIEQSSVGRFAKLAITVSEPLAERLRGSMPIPVVVMPNGYDPEHFPSLPEKPAPAQSKTLVYTGTVYAGKQDPTVLFRALKSLEEDQTCGLDALRVRFFGAKPGNLEELIAREGVGDWVDAAGHVSYEQALEAQKNAWALLLLEWADTNSPGVLTGKVFEYLASGRPVLSLGSPGEDAAGKLVEEASVGQSCGVDEACIKSFLLEVLKSDTWPHYKPDRTVIKRYARDVQARLLVEHFSKLVPGAEEGKQDVKFSLIMATRERTQEVERFLHALDNQSYQNVELILVDQNSDNRLSEIIEPYREKFAIQHLHVREQTGLSKARNLGLRHATGDVVAFPDDDCWYPASLLQGMSAWFSRQDSWDGLTCCVMDGQGRPTVARFDTRKGPITAFNVWKRSTSISLFFRRRVFQNINGFDEELGLGAGTKWGAGEDIDYPIRAMKAGFRFYYDPGLHVCHPAVEGRYQTPQQRQSFSYAYGLGAGRVLTKNQLPLWIKAYVLARPVGGTLLSMLKLKRAETLHHMWIFWGRLRGIFSEYKSS